MTRPRTILITGAGRGLGKAISLGLAELGWHCWVADINIEQAAQTAAEIQAVGGQACPIEVDISSPESVERLAFHLEESGALQGLVNCAALADGVGGNPIHEIPVADWDRILGVNLRGSFLMTRAVAPLLINSGGGAIINIGSDAATNGSANLGHYITSKGGLAALTRASATDLGPHNITVNTVSPGLTISESAAEVPEKRHLEYQSQRALERQQLPEDIVGIVAFLASPAANYITGQEILVNGGFVYR